MELPFSKTLDLTIASHRCLEPLLRHGSLPLWQEPCPGIKMAIPLYRALPCLPACLPPFRSAVCQEAAVSLCLNFPGPVSVSCLGSVMVDRDLSCAMAAPGPCVLLAKAYGVHTSTQTCWPAFRCLVCSPPCLSLSFFPSLTISSFPPFLSCSPCHPQALSERVLRGVW